MSLILLAITLSVTLGVLAFRFAIFALPVMAGIAAFIEVQDGGSGFGLALLAGVVGAVVSIGLVIAILGFARNPFLRLAALGLFAVPAAMAGYRLFVEVRRNNDFLRLHPALPTIAPKIKYEACRRS